MILQRYQKFILLKCLFLLTGCSQVGFVFSEETKLLEGRILYESSKQPLADIDVYLFKLNKPLFSMQGWGEITKVKTNANGYFSFKVSRPGSYSVRWNPEGNVIAHEFLVTELGGEKILILHKDRINVVFPWDRN